MELPTKFQITVPELPPLYLWPRRWKQVILALAILAVIIAYALLATGIIALLAILAEQIGGK
jgi:hypothetical protein